MGKGQILVGNITPGAEHLLNAYKEKFYPEAELMAIPMAGARGKINSLGRHADTYMIILDTPLIEKCRGVCDEVLSLPKTHNFVDDATFEQFLVSMYGPLEKGANELTNGIIPTEDQGTSEGSLDGLPVRFTDEVDTLGAGTVETVITPVSEPNTSSVVSTQVEDIDLTGLNMTESTEPQEDSEEIARLKEENKQLNETIERMATTQNTGDDEAAQLMADKLEKLRAELEEKNKTITEMEENSYVALGKVAKADAVLDELKTLKATKTELNDKISVLTYEKGTLEKTIEDLQEQCSKIGTLQETLQAKTTECEELQQQIETTQIEYQGKCDALDSMTQQKNHLDEVVAIERDRVADLENTISESTAQIETLKSTVAQLQAESQTMETEQQTQAEQKKQLEIELKSYKDLLAEKTQEVEQLESEKLTVERNLREKEGQLSGLQASADRQQAELEELKTNIGENTTRLQETQSTIQEYQDEINRCQQQIEQLKNEKTQLSTQLAASQDEVIEQKAQIDDYALQVEGLTKVATDYEALKQTVKDEGDQTQTEIQNLQQQLQAKDTQIAELKAAQNEASAHATESVKEKDEEINKLKRANTQLQGKVDDLTKAADSDNSKTKELRTELGKLNKRIEALTKENQDLSKANTQSSEDSEKLAEYKTRITELEMDKVGLQEIVNEMNQGVFVDLQNSALPKAKLTPILDVPTNIDKNFKVVASASTHSNMTAYQVLRKTMQKYEKKKILFVDLSMDSYIDSEFKVQGLTTPIEWLQGNQPIKQFVAKTGLKNVRVISTGLAFFNNLYLLEMNWKRLLGELAGAADIIVLYVGCLNDVVTRVVFQSLAGIMSSDIIVNATPINLRTAIFTLAGMNNTKNTKVYCANFDKVSKPIYQKLAEKYDSVVLDANAVINW